METSEKQAQMKAEMDKLAIETEQKQARISAEVDAKLAALVEEKDHQIRLLEEKIAATDKEFSAAREHASQSSSKLAELEQKLQQKEAVVSEIQQLQQKSEALRLELEKTQADASKKIADMEEERSGMHDLFTHYRPDVPEFSEYADKPVQEQPLTTLLHEVLLLLKHEHEHKSHTEEQLKTVQSELKETKGLNDALIQTNSATNSGAKQDSKQPATRTGPSSTEEAPADARESRPSSSAHAHEDRSRPGQGSQASTSARRDISPTTHAHAEHRGKVRQEQPRPRDNLEGTVSLSHPL